MRRGWRRCLLSRWFGGGGRKRASGCRVYGREVEDLPGEDQVGIGESAAAGKGFAGIEGVDRLPAVQAVLLGDVGEVGAEGAGGVGAEVDVADGGHPNHRAVSLRERLDECLSDRPPGPVM